MINPENRQPAGLLKRRADELETLFAIQQAITRRLNLDEVLQLIADEARRLTAARRAAVFLLEGESLQIGVVSGQEDAAGLLGYRMPVAGSLIGEAIQKKRPLAVAKAPADPRVRSDPRRQALVERAGVESMIAVPLLSGDKALGAISITDKISGTFGPDDERLLKILATSAVIGLENARLYQAETERRRVAEGLREVLAVLNSNRPLADVLAHITSQAVRLLAGNGGAIFRWEPEQNYLTLQASCCLPDQAEIQTTVPVGQGAIGRVVLSRKPVAVADVAALVEDEASPIPSARAGWPDYFRALLGMPLIVKDDVYGNIVVFFKEPRDFSAEEINLAQTFGVQGSLAIENAQLRQQAARAAVIRERSRLARELHDSVTQSLYSLTLLTEGWRRIIGSGQTGQIADYLGEAGEIAHQALKEMRLLIHELRPPVLDREGLTGALQQRLDAVEGRAGVKTRLLVGEGVDLPPGLENQLYRIAQEALNNVLKHARASTVKVKIGVEAGYAEVEVTDDGQGFDLDRHRGQGGLGLTSLQDRVDDLGGRLELESAPGQGTTVRVTVPLDTSSGMQ